MRYLLDSHVFLWWADKYQNLSDKVMAIFQEPGNELYLSVASVWEIQIKSQLGHLSLPRDLATIITTEQQTNGIHLLLVQPVHIYHLDKLPDHHKDPFDRMLVAQAVYENMAIITKDAAIAKYPVTVIW